MLISFRHSKFSQFVIPHIRIHNSSFSGVLPIHSLQGYPLVPLIIIIIIITMIMIRLINENDIIIQKKQTNQTFWNEKSINVRNI